MDKRSHQQFADFGVGLNEGMHLVACQLDDFARGTHTEAHLRGPTEDHADVASELSRADSRDQNLVQCRWANDLDLTSLQYKERHVGLAAVDQHFAAGDWTNHSMRSNPCNLCRTQDRKQERCIRGT